LEVININILELNLCLIPNKVSLDAEVVSISSCNLTELTCNCNTLKLESCLDIEQLNGKILFPTINNCPKLSVNNIKTQEKRRNEIC
jgi:hypothetical protein